MVGGPGTKQRMISEEDLTMRTILIHRSPFTHLTFAAGAALMLVCASVCSAGVTFTTNTVINAGDTSYDGLDIVVTNCTVTANAAHTFASLQIVGGGVLTHSPAPNGETTNHLDLTISGALVIDAASRIDVSGMGFASGSAEAPTGNPTLGAGVLWGTGCERQWHGQFGLWGLPQPE